MSHITTQPFTQGGISYISELPPGHRGLTHPNALRRAIEASGSESASSRLVSAQDQLRWLLRPTRRRNANFLAWTYHSDHRRFREIARVDLREAARFASVGGKA